MTILLYDANAAFARAYFAAKRISTDPVEAASLMLRTAILLLNPGVSRIGVPFDKTLFCWDGRQNELKNREKKPAQYHEMKSLMKDLLEFIFGAANYDHADYEGDDIVATAAFAADPADNVYIVSSDKDLQQLEGNGIKYYCLCTKAVLSKAYITHKWHIRQPSQIALALAVIGDPVDNIKGISGWGPAKCKQLFKAVTEEMNFEEAMAAIAGQIPPEKESQFYEALDRTLLKTNVPGVPKPAQLKLAPPKEVRALGVPNIALLYEEMFQAYKARGLQG